MRIIITGATGSLGAYLTRWFAAKEHEVIAVGRMENPPAALLVCAQYIRADITKPFSLPDADVCIHAAALADDSAGKEELFLANVRGTENVVNAAINAKTFIHVSSSAVYLPSETSVTEEMAQWKFPEKLTIYGTSKLLAEEILEKTARHDSVFVLRPRGIYGAGDKVLLTKLIKLVRSNKLTIPGKMQARLSMTHFSNFALGVEACINSQRKDYNVYNISDANSHVLYDVVKKVTREIYGRELAEKKIPFWVLQTMSRLKIGDVTPMFLNTVSKHLTLDISRIRKELNYNPQMNFDLALPDVVKWMKTIGVEAVSKGENSLAWQ